MSQLPALSAAIHSVNTAYPQVSCYLPGPHYSSSFTRTLPVLYQDNSIQKETRLKLLSQARNRQLQRKTCIALSRAEQYQRKNERIHARKAHKLHLKSVTREIHSMRDQAEKAAVVIQRWVRGWLCRLHLDLDMIEAEKREVKGKIGEMTTFARRFYLITGNGPSEAATVLQRAYRRYRKVKMIRTVEHGYLLYRDYLERQLTPVITRFLRMRLAASHLNSLKFQVYRTHRLEEIRLTLARLRLERWWHRLSLNFKSIQEKIKRFRRRKYAHKIRTTKQMAMAAVIMQKAGEEGTAEHTQETETDGLGDEEKLRRGSLCISDLSSERLQALEEARERKRHQELEQKMKACGIYKAREMPLFPLLAEKTLSETPHQPMFSRLMMPTEVMRYRCTTAYESPKYLSLHKRTATTTPQSILTKLSTSPPLSSRDAEFRKPRKRQEEPRYTQPTASYIQAVEARNACLPSESFKLPLKGWTPKGNVLMKTYAFMCKERQRKGLKTAKQHWIPMTSVYEAAYVPGLDNSAVEKREFHAKPLDKRILRRPGDTRMWSIGVETYDDGRSSLLNSSI